MHAENFSFKTQPSFLPHTLNSSSTGQTTLVIYHFHFSHAQIALVIYHFKKKMTYFLSLHAITPFMVITTAFYFLPLWVVFLEFLPISGYHYQCMHSEYTIKMQSCIISFNLSWTSLQNVKVNRLNKIIIIIIIIITMIKMSNNNNNNYNNYDNNNKHFNKIIKLK